MIDANDYTIHHLTKDEFYDIIEAIEYARESAIIRNSAERIDKYQHIANIVFDKTTSVMKPNIDLRAWLFDSRSQVL